MVTGNFQNIGDSELSMLEDRIGPIFREANDEIEVSRIIDNSMSIGKYKLKQLLSCGGQAYVFLAFDTELDRDVVIKLYRRRISDDRKARIVREGRAMSKIRNENVARCLTTDEFNGMPFLVMEHIEGDTLSEYAQRRHPDSEECVRLAVQITSGLQDVHEAGFLHLDLKPNNIMVDHKGVVKLIDFGLAEAIGDLSTEPGSGTPSYLAPERANEQAEKVDARTDLFGVGGILYFLLTGVAPFSGRTKEDVRSAAKLGRIEKVSQLNPSVPGNIENLCHKCLATEPAERFPTVNAFKNSANGILESKTRAKELVWRGALGLGTTIAILGVLLYLLPTMARNRESVQLSKFIDTRVLDVLDNVAAITPQDLKSGFELEGQLIGSDGTEFSKDEFGSYLIPDIASFSLRVKAAEACHIGVAALNQGDAETGIKKVEPIFPYTQSELSSAHVMAGEWRELPELKATETGVVEYLYVAACDFAWLPSSFSKEQTEATDDEEDTLRGIKRTDKPEPKSELLIPFKVVSGISH